MAFGGKPHRILPDRVRQTRPYPCAMDDGKQMEIDSATGQTNVRASHWPRSCAHCESMLASVAARVNRAMSNVVAIDARRLVESDIVVNLAQGFCRISSPLGGEGPLAVYVARRLRELEVEVELQDVVQDRPKESVPSVPLEFATVLLYLAPCECSVNPRPLGTERARRVNAVAEATGIEAACKSYSSLGGSSFPTSINQFLSSTYQALNWIKAMQVNIRRIHGCPSGYYGDARRACTCAPGAVGRYQKQ
jgi:hypothetical protein